MTGRENMELMENFERKFATVKRLGVVGNEGEAIGWVVSIGVKVMSLEFTGRRKLLMSANASPDIASNNMHETNSLRTTDLLVPRVECSVLFSLNEGARSISLRSLLSTAKSDSRRVIVPCSALRNRIS